jgi:CDGSH-type Zn-finger protein
MSDKNLVKGLVDGPLLCTGQIEVLNPFGDLLQKGTEIALCRCGGSRNKPFCDGSHQDEEFECDGIFTGITSEPLEEDGPLLLTVHPNAGLFAQGPMTVLSSDDNFVTTRNEAALCRCGKSGNKPFCDISHKGCEFETDLFG